jgi:hypothetical protein
MHHDFVALSLSINLDVAAVRQNAAISTPASMRRSTETPLRFMALMRVRSWTWKLPMNLKSATLIINSLRILRLQGLKART